MKGCRWCRKDLFAFDSDHTVIRATERRADLVGEVLWVRREEQVKEISSVASSVKHWLDY